MLLATLYAPIVLALLYFFDVTTTGILLTVLSATHIATLALKKERKEAFFLPLAVFVCSLFAAIFGNESYLRFAPLLISLGFLAVFALYAINKKSIPLEATIRFKKGELSERQKAFLASSHNWWIITLAINSGLHIYTLIFGDTLLWAVYSSFGWYVLFGVTLAINIIIGKLVVEKNIS